MTDIACVLMNQSTQTWPCPSSSIYTHTTCLWRSYLLQPSLPRLEPSTLRDPNRHCLACALKIRTTSSDVEASTWVLSGRERMKRGNRRARPVDIARFIDECLSLIHKKHTYIYIYVHLCFRALSPRLRRALATPSRLLL